MEVFRTPGKGCGLRTNADLPKGAFVMEYCGEVLPLDNCIQRSEEHRKKGMRHLYFMTLEADTVRYLPGCALAARKEEPFSGAPLAVAGI